MNLGKFFALFRSPEQDEEVRRLEEERVTLERKLSDKRDNMMKELEDLEACSKNAKNTAKRHAKELKALSSTPPPVEQIPTVVIREKLPSKPELA